MLDRVKSKMFGVFFIPLLALILVFLMPHVSAFSAQRPELELAVKQQDDSATVLAQVILHRAEGMAAGQLDITYDAELFTIQEISKDALLERGGFNFEYSFDQDTGLISLAWFSLEQTMGSGPLSRLVFEGAKGQLLELGIQNVRLYREDGTIIPLNPNKLELQINRNTVLVNGSTEMLETAPFMQGSRTMVPVRFISEQLGADVIWVSDTSQVLIEADNRHIMLTVDSVEAFVNGESEMLDEPAIIKDGRTFVPLRFISEILGANVIWHGDTGTITIELP